MATQQSTNNDGIKIIIGILIALAIYAYNSANREKNLGYGKTRTSGYANRVFAPESVATPAEPERYKGLTDAEKDRIWRSNMPVTVSAEERKSLREGQEP